MRIRSTKPEFWRSRTVASVSWDARLVLKGLESYVDDNGVGKDDLELICGDLFPRDLAREGSRILARVSEAITELSQAGLLWRYEVDGASLLYISSWESVQRVDKPQAGRFPRPDGTRNYRESTIRESVENPREPSRALAPGTGEQGNRGTGEQGNRRADARRRAPRPIPDDWTPNDLHREQARAARVDVEREAAAFTAHAQANDRRLADWNAGFRQWLTKAKPDPATRTTTRDRYEQGMAVAARLEQHDTPAIGAAR